MKPSPDFVEMACITSSVSYREWLTKDELVGALLSGEAPPRRTAHLRTLLEEAPEALVRGLVEQMCKSYPNERIEENVLRLAAALEVEGRARRILGRS